MNPTTNIDRMRVSGGTSPTAINGDHALGATVNGRPSYVLAAGTDIIWSGTYWEIRSASTARWRSASPHGTLPSDVAVWQTQNASTGTIAVAAISRGPDPLIGSSSPGAPDAAGDLIVSPSPGAGMAVSGTLAPDATGWLAPAGTLEGRPAYSLEGEDVTGLPPLAADDTQIYWDPFTPGWVLAVYSGGELTGAWLSASDVATPDLASGWADVGDATGVPVVTLTLLPAAGSVIGSASPAAPVAPGDVI